MPKAFSIYLDLVRFLAACLVYMYHSNQRWLVEDILPVSRYGHSSVIVFFVLSGFVIAYVTDTKESDWLSYTSSRLSRVYSVALPAVFLTIALDAIGRSLAPDIYSSYPWDRFALRIASSLSMTNEVWFVSVTSFSNVPYWSICYESWYYVAFAAFTFLGARLRWAAIGLLALVLGPKVSLLAPIWVLGVILYRWELPRRMPEWAGWACAIVSTALIVVYHGSGTGESLTRLLQDALGERWHRELTFSKFFVGDYLLGVLVFANFAGMRRIAHRLTPILLPIERPVRAAANYTFTTYLLHQPLFVFWGAVLHGDPKGYGTWALVTAASAASIVAIGTVTEGRRAEFRRWVTGRLQRFSRAALT